MDNSAILSLYAVTPAHAGSGSSFGVVDLPIQRERHTNWPHIQASGVKGALREHFETFYPAENGHDVAGRVFGHSKGNQGTQAGAISVSDAKLLAFPMRSSVAPFVWVTSRALLERACRDLGLVGRTVEAPQSLAAPNRDTAIVLSGDDLSGKRVLLEDLEVEVGPSRQLPPELAALTKDATRLLVVHDDILKYCVDQCTEVQPQIAIEDTTGTTKDGSLRYQELLPADSIMYTVLFYSDTRDPEAAMKHDAVIKALKDALNSEHIQMGGDLTLGRGIFAVTWN